MNKHELAVQISDQVGTTQSEALNVVDLLIETVLEELAKEDGKLTLVGFGTFKSMTKQKKKGRNPRTGEEIVIPKRRTVKFIPGKKLKDLVI